MGKIDGRGRAAFPELLRVLRDDKDPKVRSAAAFAISKIAFDLKRSGTHATEIYDTVVAALEDPDPITRMNSAMALGMLEGDARPAMAALEKAIRKKENNVRVLTFSLTIREQMLTDIGAMGEDGKDGVKLLEELLLDDEQATRNTCARALGRIGPAAKDAVPMLREAIKDENEAEMVQETALEALKLIDPQEAAKLADK